MKGYHVPRRFGWDTHGVPVEHIVDKNLGITGREDVLKLGIDKYNAECRAIVMTYASEWKATIERVGRWIDVENDYKVGLPTEFPLPPHVFPTPSYTNKVSGSSLVVGSHLHGILLVGVQAAL